MSLFVGQNPCSLPILVRLLTQGPRNPPPVANGAWAALDPALLARGSLRWSFPPRLAMAGAPCSWCSCCWLARNLANCRPLLRSIAAAPLADAYPRHSRCPPRCVKTLQTGGSTHTLCQPQLGNSSTLSRGLMNPSSLKTRCRNLHTCRVWRRMLRRGSLACIR